jgi:hypothetical protein
MVANLQEHNADLRDQVEHLRRELDTRNEELRRKDTIIMAMTQRIPELEATPETRDNPEAASEGTGRGEVPPASQESAQRRSWLHRFFFGSWTAEGRAKQNIGCMAYVTFALLAPYSSWEVHQEEKRWATGRRRREKLTPSG